VVRIVKSYRIKPVLLSNGVGLEPGLVHDLKKAGLFGFTFHVDSHQTRPGWEGKNEEELNELRLYLANMVKKEAGLTCGFNMTIFPDTLKYVPTLVEWASRNIEKVHSYSLIALRQIVGNRLFDYYAGNKKIDISETIYYSSKQYKKISSSDLYSKVKQAIPEFKLCAYLGGTVLPNSVKWAVGGRIGSAEKTFGNIGAKTMELFQNMHHFFRGRYLSFSKPSISSRAKFLFIFGLFDQEIRKTFTSNHYRRTTNRPTSNWRGGPL
jgi:hypothetical protein